VLLRQAHGGELANFIVLSRTFRLTQPLTAKYSGPLQYSHQTVDSAFAT